MPRSSLRVVSMLLVACAGATLRAAELPPDVMRQLTSPVAGFRGEIANVEVLPDGEPALPSNPDLPKMAEAALHYLSNNPVPENKYDCRFSNFLLNYPPTPLPDPSKEWLDPTAVGDTEVLNDVAFNQMREMCGSDIGRKAQQEVHKRLVGYVRSTPGELGDDMCWCYAFAGSPDHDTPYATPWTTDELLRSEVDLYRATGDENHKKMARRLFEGLRKAASWDTDRAFYPNGCQPFKPGTNCKGYEGHYPAILGPVTYYSRHCNDPEALQFARTMAEGLLCDLQPIHVHKPDGSVRGHNAVLMLSVRGLAEFASETNDPRCLEWVKAAYQYYNNNGFDTGWLPEFWMPEASWSPDRYDHNNHSEMCLISAMTEIELWLARAGWPSYWDRVDRTFRNTIVPSQFMLTPELERMWREIHKDRPTVELDRGIELLKDLQGGFLSALTPNDYVFEVNPKGKHAGTAEYRGRKIVLDMMGCCPPEGMRIPYYVWRDTVQEMPHGVFVNLAFDRDAPKAKVVSQMPRKGQIAVTAKADADFFLRAPGWAPRSMVKATRSGEPVAVQWGGPAFAYVVFPKVKAGETVKIRWPLVKFTQQVSHKIFDGEERTYTYTWVGSTVTNVDPQGEWLPLYEHAPIAK